LKHKEHQDHQEATKTITVSWTLPSFRSPRGLVSPVGLGGRSAQDYEKNLTGRVIPSVSAARGVAVLGSTWNTPPTLDC
jgi:hypothetical protein